MSAQTVTVTDELLPCPFCGGNDLNEDPHGIFCGGCHAQVLGSGVASDRQTWNRRPASLEVGASDWTVSASETSRAVLDYLGVGSDPSLEPGADRRRDNVAKIITRHFDALSASPSTSQAGGVEVKRPIDPRHFEILAEAMAEVKATSDGLSDQPIADIVAGCLEEIAELAPSPSATAVAEPEFKPCVIHFEEGDWSQMLLEDGPAVTGRTVLVEPLLRMSDRQLVGFTWSGATPPTAGPDREKKLREAIKTTRALVSEGAATGFNPLDGDWAERLYVNQAALSAALSREQGGD